MKKTLISPCDHRQIKATNLVFGGERLSRFEFGINDISYNRLVGASTNGPFVLYSEL